MTMKSISTLTIIISIVLAPLIICNTINEKQTINPALKSRALFQSSSLNNIELYAEQIVQQPEKQAEQTTQKLAVQVPIAKNGAVEKSFDPSAPSQTCSPASRYIKSYQANGQSFTAEKIIQQNFVINFSKDQSLNVQDTTLQLIATGENDKYNPTISPSTVYLSADHRAKEEKFSMQYNCDQLLSKGETYYDNIKITVADRSDSFTYEFIVVCDANRMKSFDINFIVLFGIAVSVVIIAIKTPNLLIFNEMSAQEQEQTDLKLSSAVCFFISASVMLFVLYLFIDTLREVFSILILISCIGCASIIIEDFLLQFFKPGPKDFLRHEIKFPLFGNTSYASIIGTLCGIALSLSWYFTHNWILSNTLAILLALTFLKTLRLTTLIPGMVLLGLLFFYDIFWVFLSPYFTSGGQSVMVVVATGLDIPIKIVMPHLSADYPTSACSLLGLGDILIPGIFICFMSRFGFEVAKTNSYFYGAIIAYIISLLACGASLWIYKTGQPALLYIVPALFIAVISIGCSRGEWNKLKEGLPKIQQNSNNEDNNAGTYRGVDLEDVKVYKADFEMTSITRA